MIYAVNYLTNGTKVQVNKIFKSNDVRDCEKYLARFTKTQKKKLAQYIESCDKLPMEIDYRKYFYEHIGWAEVIDEKGLSVYILGLKNCGYEVTIRDWTGDAKDAIAE